MKDLFTSGSARDWRQRYEGTFAWLHSNNKRSLVAIQSVSDHRISFVTPGGVNGWVDADSDIEFEFTQVPSGFFNTHIGLAYITRRPERQYQRGISPSNTNVSFFEHMEDGISANLLESIYSQEKFQMPDKMPKYWAFNRVFAKVGNYIQAKQHKVATISGNKVVITADMFKQELIDLIRRNKLTLEII